MYTLKNIEGERKKITNEINLKSLKFRIKHKLRKNVHFPRIKLKKMTVSISKFVKKFYLTYLNIRIVFDNSKFLNFYYMQN